MGTDFSLYVPRDSGLHGWHPLTKLLLVLFLLVLGLLLPGVWSTYIVFAVLIVPLAIWGQVLPNVLSGSLKVVLPFAISLVLVQGLFWPGGTPVLHLGPISFKEEGLFFAARGTGRILVMVSSFLLLTMTTRADELMLALTQKGVPNSITYILLSTIQIVPRFQAKANTILDAQRSRGLETEGNLWVRLKAIVPLVQPLLVGSFVDIEERAIALEVRAFGRAGEKTSLLELHDTTPQRVLRWLLFMATLAVIGWRIYLIFAPAA